MKKIAFNAVVLLLFTQITAKSQVTPEDYKRADNLNSIVSGKVFYSDVRPNWIGNTPMFFYENNTPSGKEYIIVNARLKTRRQAFDQVKFAKSLTAETGNKAVPGKLPITNVLFSDRQVSFAFVYDGYNWICNLKDYSLVKREKVASRIQQNGWDWGFRDETTNEPVLSPDKKWTAFIRDYNVYIRSNDDKKEYRLSYDGGTGNYYSSFIRWSGDSKKIVAYRVIPAEKHMIHYVESSPADQLQPRHFSYEYQKPGDAIPQKYPQLFDAVQRKHIKLSDSIIPNQYSLNDIRWSADNSHFTFEYNQRGHQVYQVIRVDATTGRQKVIVNETSPTFIDYSGKHYRHNIDSTGEIIWASERDGWNHLYLYDSQTGEVKNQITSGDWLVRGVTNVDEKNRRIIFQASGKEPGDPYFVHYYMINFDGSGLTRLTDGEGTHTAYFSNDYDYFVDTWSRVDMPPITVLRSAKDGQKLMDLEKADITELLKTGIRLPEVFTSKGRDGVTDIWGIIIKPMNFDPLRKYPVIENIYAGPHSSFVPKSFRSLVAGMHQLAELGFIVVQVDGMGTSNRSRAFHDICWKNIADAGFPDRILWMKAAAKEFPYMDIERVGVYGTSAGGQNAAGAVLFHPEFYKVAVASCGCHDNRMDKMWWNEQWMGWPVGEQYSLSSNIDNAWRLKGKLLLLNGELDNNVDPASTEQLVNALIKADKDFEYVFLPGQKHTSGGAYGERKRRDFFVKNLLGADAPDWNTIKSAVPADK
ncbi:MAG: DPP IV N-terminal domain-containing protein [Chloroflexota bacterium]